MKMLTTITLQSSHKRLRAGPIRSPAALPRMAVRGRAFLSEHPEDNRSRYYKGGQSESVPAIFYPCGGTSFALLCPLLEEKAVKPSHPLP